MAYQRISKIFPPAIRYSIVDSKFVGYKSNSHKLLLENNIINPVGNSLYNILPLGQRSINKLIKIIHSSMKNINAQEVSLSPLISRKLLEISGKSKLYSDNLHTVTCTNDDEFILAPTYEEPVCNLLSDYRMTKDLLPLKLYQINCKYRREKNSTTHGLLRTREFIMKDLYSFNIDEKSAIDAYEEVHESYKDIFKKLGLPVHRVKASVGNIGGKFSHEFILLNDVGEDILLKCEKCGTLFFGDCNEHSVSCDSSVFKKLKGIELAHTFFLSTQYTDAFDVKFTDNNHRILMQMGSYGIGITRLLAACIEHLSTENDIIWPSCIAPYKVCIISPKYTSKNYYINGNEMCNSLLLDISKIPEFQDEILFHDKDKLTIGNRINFAKNLGIPLIIVCGKSVLEAIPKIELIQTRSNETFHFTKDELLSFLSNFEINDKN